jgi:uncharacterized protein (TIGR02231 family)
MRALYAFALMLPCPALADAIAASSTITAVTVYPNGAEITRQVTFDAPAGSHDLVITDLPANVDPAMFRLAPDTGLTVGAFALRTDRLPPHDPDAVLTTEQRAAKAELERLEGDQRSALAAVGSIEARIEAAEAQIAFLRGVTGQTNEAATADSLKTVSAMIATEVLAARQTVIAAQSDLYPAQAVLQGVQEKLGLAQLAMDQLASVDMDYAALSVAVTRAEAGQSTLTVTHFVQDASWQPVYDLKLTQEKGDNLSIERGVLVTQYSGEDWSDVALTLSTAQPSQQSGPSTLWPEYRQITDRQQDQDLSKADATFAEPVMEPEAVVAAAPSGRTVSALAQMQGDTITYVYPTPVDIGTGVDNLRLALDALEVAPTVEAWAVPRSDRTAFMMANFSNTTGQVLLPGPTYMYREGVHVGSGMMDLMPAGADADIPFGAIEGLRLTRDMPMTNQGDRGVFISSNERQEVARLQVENLTDKAWSVRVFDQVPYSEQDDLEISYTASPEPTHVDIDGQRGILAWDIKVPAGQTSTIDLTTTLQWPDGMDLQ